MIAIKTLMDKGSGELRVRFDVAPHRGNIESHPQFARTLVHQGLGVNYNLLARGRTAVRGLHGDYQREFSA
ncbi:hypothetical protein PUN4_1160010 [Paraburkholderia unamae]|nr:hypothetical protein PUN4_1160010 [Paraburkholderia unamae]